MATKAEIESALDTQIDFNKRLQEDLERVQLQFSDAVAEVAELKEVIAEMGNDRPKQVVPGDEGQELVEFMLQPFAPEQINQIAKGKEGAPKVYLDYVGHADITHRLLMWDPQYRIEFAYHNQDGSPRMDNINGMVQAWFYLHIRGRDEPILEVGSCRDNKPDVYKELTGDFLRRAVMRLGAGLDLWAKGERNWADASGDALADPLSPEPGFSAPQGGTPPPVVMPAPIAAADPTIEVISEDQVNELKGIVQGLDPASRAVAGQKVNERWGKLSLIPAQDFEEAKFILQGQPPADDGEAVQKLIDAGLVERGVGHLSPEEEELRNHRRTLLGMQRTLSADQAENAAAALREAGLVPLNKIATMDGISQAEQILRAHGAKNDQDPF